jgi:hypothetical protein
VENFIGKETKYSPRENIYKKKQEIKIEIEKIK